MKKDILVTKWEILSVIYEDEVKRWLQGLKPKTVEFEIAELYEHKFQEELSPDDVDLALRTDIKCAWLTCRNAIADVLRPRITAELKRNIDAAAADDYIETATLSEMLQLCICIYKSAPMQNKDCEDALRQLTLNPTDIDSQKYFLLSFSAFALLEIPPVAPEKSPTEQ